MQWWSDNICVYNAESIISADYRSVPERQPSYSPPPPAYALSVRTQKILR